MNSQIVIVGAGIAGLTAGYYVKKAGYHPIVLEKSSRVGGRMITEVVDGFTIDCGAQFLMDSYPVLISLIDENKLSSKFIKTSQYMGTIRERKIRRTDRGNVLSLLRSGLLSFPGWLRFIRKSLLIMMNTSSLPTNDFTAWTNYDNKDAEIWSNSYFGQEITDYIVEPMFDGLFFQSLHSMSMAFTLSVISTFLYRKVKNITALVGGIGLLPECLASQLDVQLNTSVTSISMSSAGVELETSAGPIVADRVILATTAPIAKTLYLSPGVIERELLDTSYSSTLVIALAMQDSFRLMPDIEGIYGILVPKVERNIISAMAFEASKDKSRLGGGHLLVIFLSGAAGKQMIDWNEEAILPAVLTELDKYVANVKENIRFTRIYRWNKAMPSSPVGRIKNVARYRECINDATKIFLAGDYVGAPSTEGAAETGKWAAEALLKNLL